MAGYGDIVTLIGTNKNFNKIISLIKKYKGDVESTEKENIEEVEYNYLTVIFKDEKLCDAFIKRIERFKNWEAELEGSLLS